MPEELEEHFGYISDDRRLELFRLALAAVVRPGDVVADVGCGFGILGLMCIEAGAARVFGIDRTDAIEIARETMARAGLGDRYHCLREHSFRAVLPEPVDLIVCDHVGYFGFDYGIVKTLGDARRRFLKPGGRIVPGRIDLALAGIESPDCRKLADAWGSDRVPEAFRWLRGYGANLKYSRTFTPDEVATAPAKLGTIDLHAESPELFSFKARLRAERDCMLDGLGGWFECELAEGVRMTNSPLAQDRIDRPQVFLPFDRPADVKAGDEIEVSLSVRHEESIIAWKVAIPRTGFRTKQSTWNSRILGSMESRERADRVAHLNPAGQARKLLLDRVDGMRTHREIEAELLRDRPDLFPSPGEISNFILHELGKSTD